MIDRNDLDLRIHAYRNRINTLNYEQWQHAATTRTTSSLRRQLAAVLISLANRVDNRGIASASHNGMINPNPTGSFTS